MSCLKRSIQSPGVGMNRVQPGCSARATYGRDIPMPAARKMAKIVAGGLREGEPQRCAEKRRRTGRRQNGGEHPVEEAAPQSLTLSCTANEAPTRSRQSYGNHSEQTESENENECREKKHECR